MADIRERRFHALGSRIRTAILAIVVLVIGGLTLSPQAIAERVTFGHWCIICGDGGGADFVANVIMFAPLGAALSLVGFSRTRAVGACLLYSIVIELTQLFFVTGRYSTIGDVASNTLGGALGVAMYAAWSVWAAPSRRSARRFTIAAALAWVAAYVGAAALLQLDPGVGPDRPSRSPLPFTPGYGWFAGRVSEATVNGERFDHGGTGPIILSGRVAPGTRASVRAASFDRRTELVPMLFVHAPGEASPRLLIGQFGPSIALRVRRRAAEWRLRDPHALVGGVFPDGIRHPYAIDAFVDQDSVAMRVSIETLPPRSMTFRVSPALGWALLSPIPRIESPLVPAMSVVWLLGLTIPLGYWAGWWRRERQGVGAAAAVLLVTATLAFVPLALGFAPAAWWEWSGAIGGVALGAGASALAQRSMRTRPSASS
jgi:hypothetical protein